MKKLLIGAITLIALTNIHAESFIRTVDIRKAAGASFSIKPEGEPGIQKSIDKPIFDFKLDSGQRMDKDTIITVDGVSYHLPYTEDLPKDLRLVLTDIEPKERFKVPYLSPLPELKWTLKKLQ